jgi:hypothetical protein
MLERTQPERYGRNQKNSMGKRELRALANDLVNIVREEVFDPFVSERIEKRVQATVNYAMRHAWDQRRTGNKLRQAMEFFENKDSQHPWSDPLAAAQEAPYPMDASYAPEGYDQQGPQDDVGPATDDGMQELVQQFVRLATLPETEEERAERLAEGGGDSAEDGAAGTSDDGTGEAGRRMNPTDDISTERNATMGGSTFGDALRAHLTKLVGDGVDEIEENARNAEVNADPAAESEGTFGAKKGAPMSGTEPTEAPATPASDSPAPSDIPAPSVSPAPSVIPA